MEENKKINLSISEGDAFYTHENAISFSPLQFIFNFKSITPRIDMRNRDGTNIINLKHNVVILEPFKAKEFVEMLQKSIKQYEKEFGKIDKPDILKKLEAKNKKLAKKKKKDFEFKTYMG